MSELLLVERLLYFAVAFGICFVVGIVHGFLIVRHPSISLLVPIGGFVITIGLILYEGWEDYSSSWFSASSPYVIIGCIVGMVVGEVLGLLLGQRT